MEHPDSAWARPAPVSRSPLIGSTPSMASTRSGRRASARTGRSSAASRRASRLPTYPLAPAISSTRARVLAEVRPPEKCAPSGCSSGTLQTAAIAYWNPAAGAAACRPCPRSQASEDCYFLQNKLCALNLGKLLHHLPAGRTGPSARAAAGLRVPHRADHGRLRVPSAQRLSAAAYRSAPAGERAREGRP